LSNKLLRIPKESWREFERWRREIISNIGGTSSTLSDVEAESRSRSAATGEIRRVRQELDQIRRAFTLQSGQIRKLQQEIDALKALVR